MTAVLIAILASLAACGGKEKPGSAQARYIEQGDVICEETNSKLSGVGTGTDTATLEKLRDIWASTYQQLNAIPIPGEGQEQAQLFIAEVHNAALTAEAAVQASMIGDQAKVTRSLAVLETSAQKATEAADNYGFKVCSQS